MSEINYYIRNWGRIFIWLAIYCIAELIFGSFALIFKLILVIVLVINNRKFLYLLKDGKENFKKYFRSLQLALIFLIIGSVVQIVDGLVFNIPSYYYYGFYGYYEYPDWYMWVNEHEDLIKLILIIVENGLIVGVMVAEGIAWSRLRSAFGGNLLDTKSYHRDNFLRATKLMLTGVILLAIVYFATILYQVGFLLFGERYYYTGYPIFLGIDYYLSTPYRYGTGYTLTYWIVRAIGSVGIILLGIGYGIMGSNLKNPFLLSNEGAVGNSARPNPMFGIHLGDANNTTNNNNDQGDRINHEIRFCPNCGAEIRPEARFCLRCGINFSKYRR
jgi:hypothetical protein